MTDSDRTTFTLYRARIGNAVGRWNVAEGETVPDDILGYPVETIVVVPVERLEQAFNEGRREGVEVGWNA